jgi:hypothetical protein
MASKIAAQLYTVRAACQTPEDFADTVKRVAEMGYESGAALRPRQGDHATSTSRTPATPRA